MKAKDLIEGLTVIAEDGEKLVITEVVPGRGFVMGLKGHHNKQAIEIHHAKGWTLLHPEQDVATV